MPLRQQVAERVCKGIADSVGHTHQALNFNYNRQRAGKRLTIGYVSPDFRGHSVAVAFRGLIDNHDRDRFSFNAYSLHAGKTAPRRYTDHELLAIVQQAGPRDQDTPRYLVGMINDLNAFTDFSTQQLIENPTDTELYDRIREDTSYARAQLERALSVVAEVNQLLPVATS